MKLLALVGVIWMVAQTLPPPFPREGITKILENDYVVAWNAQFVKNLRTPMHEHKMDLAAFFLTGGQVNAILPDGTVREGQPFAGDRALFQPRGVIHIEEYQTDGTRAIGLELKDGSLSASSAGIDERLDPVKVEPATYRSLLDHERVRIIETILGPNSTPARHSHPARLVVEPAACPGSNPPRSVVTLDGGMRVWWVEAETHVDDQFRSTQRCRRIEFEVKGAR